MRGGACWLRKHAKIPNHRHYVLRTPPTLPSCSTHHCTLLERGVWLFLAPYRCYVHTGKGMTLARMISRSTTFVWTCSLLLFFFLPTLLSCFFFLATTLLCLIPYDILSIMRYTVDRYIAKKTIGRPKIVVNDKIKALGSYPADSPNRSYYIMSKRVTYGLLQAGSKNRLGGLVAILAGQKIPPCSEVLTLTKKGLPARKKHLKVSIHFLLGFSRRPQNYIWCKYENFHIVCVVVVQSGPCPA